MRTSPKAPVGFYGFAVVRRRRGHGQGLGDFAAVSRFRQRARDARDAATRGDTMAAQIAFNDAEAFFDVLTPQEQAEERVSLDWAREALVGNSAALADARAGQSSLESGTREAAAAQRAVARLGFGQFVTDTASESTSSVGRALDGLSSFIARNKLALGIAAAGAGALYIYSR